MGLIGSYLGLVYCGGTGYYLSPISFLKNPMVWLRAISKYRGTHTQAPNFAYALTCRKFKDAVRSKGAVKDASLDLSTLLHMINAAEPIDPKAILDFYHTFAPYGLPVGVVIPTYGLAEHTVFVCSVTTTFYHTLTYVPKKILFVSNFNTTGRTVGAYCHQGCL